MMTPQKMTPFLTQRQQQRRRGSGTRTNLPSSQNVHIATENSQISNITSTSNIQGSVCVNICWSNCLEIPIFSWRITSARRAATAAISRPIWRGTSPTWVRFLKLKNIFSKSPCLPRFTRSRGGRVQCAASGTQTSGSTSGWCTRDTRSGGHNILVYLKKFSLYGAVFKTAQNTFNIRWRRLPVGCSRLVIFGWEPGHILNFHSTKF